MPKAGTAKSGGQEVAAKMAKSLVGVELRQPLTPIEQNYFARISRAEERSKNCNLDLAGGIAQIL